MCQHPALEPQLHLQAMLAQPSLAKPSALCWSGQDCLCPLLTATTTAATAVTTIARGVGAAVAATKGRAIATTTAQSIALAGFPQVLLIKASQQEVMRSTTLLCLLRSSRQVHRDSLFEEAQPDL